MIKTYAITFWLLTAPEAQSLDHFSDEFIQHINDVQSTWTAGRNFHIETLKVRTKVLSLASTRLDKKKSNVETIYHEDILTESLPKSFDARDHWLDCPSIKEIGDQGNCESSWAFAPVSAITDRICIHSNGTKKVHLSVYDLLSCCLDDCGIGCWGGETSESWNYWVTYGIVSGGQYNSSEGCKPYEIPPCEHYINGSRPACDDHNIIDTPLCVTECKKGYEIAYDDDLVFGDELYFPYPEEVTMQKEIYKNGPITSDIIMHEDIFHYKSGVYKYVAGRILGQRAVKIIGWGEENNTKYWLVANSWNTDWGDKGFFKILRGTNECEIESKVTDQALPYK